MTSIVPTNFASPLSGTETLRAFSSNTSAIPACGEDFLLTANQIAALASSNPKAAIAVGASATAVIGGKYLFNTASGSTLTLPAALGTGGNITVFVTTTTTSGADKVLAASSADFFNGIADGENANTAKVFASTPATNHSLQMPFAGSQPSGGFAGDWFELTDISVNLWQVKGMYQAGTTPTTPFSSATT
jgi:hypothetical protein